MTPSALEPQAAARVRAFVLKELVRDEELELSLDEPLFSSGLLDSFSVTRLIVFLEDSFGVRVPIARVRLDDFDTIERSLELVTRLKAEVP